MEELYQRHCGSRWELLCMRQKCGTAHMLQRFIRTFFSLGCCTINFASSASRCYAAKGMTVKWRCISSDRADWLIALCHSNLDNTLKVTATSADKSRVENKRLSSSAWLHAFSQDRPAHGRETNKNKNTESHYTWEFKRYVNRTRDVSTAKSVSPYKYCETSSNKSADGRQQVSEISLFIKIGPQVDKCVSLRKVTEWIHVTFACENLCLCCH